MCMALLMVDSQKHIKTLYQNYISYLEQYDAII